MKKLLCAAIAAMMLLGCAYAKGVDTEMWQHEAGWISFQLALSRDELESVWEESVKVFGKKMGLKGLTVKQMQKMLLQGYSMESGVDELNVEGNRFTGKKADGTEVFSHQYEWVETLKDKKIMGGKKVHVFRTKEKGAGKYTYLLMMEPVKTEGENADYTTFNLICTGKKDYKTLLNAKKGSAVIPCTMIEKDTGTEGLAYAIERLFTSSSVINK